MSIQQAYESYGNNLIGAGGGGGSLSQIQSDWNVSDNARVDYIKNKPDVPSDADDLDYSNTSSELSATKVQGAIDELAKPTFTEAGTRANIASGEKLSTIFGKIKKWFSDLTDMFVSKTGDTMSGNLIIDQANGTTSTAGSSAIKIGNATPTGTAGNSYGLIHLCSNTAYRVNISAPNITANRNINMPNKAGTIALLDDIPSVPFFLGEATLTTDAASWGSKLKYNVSYAIPGIQTTSKIFVQLKSTTNVTNIPFYITANMSSISPATGNVSITIEAVSCSSSTFGSNATAKIDIFILK